jgi:hypothetical protein
VRYVVLMYGDESVWDGLDEAGMQEVIDRHDRFSRVVDEHPALTMLGGEALQTADSATTVRHGNDGKRVLTDGPFAEAVEQLGGFYLVEAPDLDTLLDAVDELPLYYAKEIRPVDENVPG